MKVLENYIKQFKSGKDDNDSEKGADDDDDIIIKNESDSEENESSDKDKAFFLTLTKHIQMMAETFDSPSQPEEIVSTLNGHKLKPLGMTKLRMIELLTQIVKVNQDVIFTEVLTSRIMRSVMKLCAQHPWNNLFHIKAMELWDCIIKSTLNAEQKFAVVKEADTVGLIVAMSKPAYALFNSKRKTRNGNMAFVVKLANLLKNLQNEAFTQISKNELDLVFD